MGLQERDPKVAVRVSGLIHPQRVLVFSSVSGCWSVSMSTSCNDLGLNGLGILVSGHFTYDCCYWKLYHASMLIKLDMNTMQFCTVDLPPGHDECVIVESGRNKIAMFSLNYEDRSVDYYTFSQNGSEESHEWHIMSTIPLPADYIIGPCFTGPAEGYIFLEGCPIESDGKHPVCFSLEIKSFKIERFSITSRFCVHPYFGFSPFMSPIRIQRYAEE